MCKMKDYLPSGEAGGQKFSILVKGKVSKPNMKEEMSEDEIGQYKLMHLMKYLTSTESMFSCFCSRIGVYSIITVYKLYDGETTKNRYQFVFICSATMVSNHDNWSIVLHW